MNILKFKKQYLILFLILIILILMKLLFTIPFFNQIKIAVINIIIPFLISFVMVYIFHPILQWLEKRLSIKTWVTTLILMFLYTIGLVLLINFIIPLFFHQLWDLFQNLPEYLKRLDHYYERLQIQYTLFQNEAVITFIKDRWELINNNIGQSLVDFTLSNIGNLIKFLLYLILIPIIIFIMVKDYKLFYSNISNFLTKHNKSDFIHLLKNIDKKLGIYIRGQLIVISYMFIGHFIVLYSFGMPNAFLFSLIIALTNLIPYLGPYLGGIPLWIYAFFVSPQLFVVSIVLVLIMQQIDANIAQPLVFGSSLNIHPLVIMTVMMIGSAIAGVFGLVISVPLFIIMREVYIFSKHKLKNPVESS